MGEEGGIEARNVPAFGKILIEKDYKRKKTVTNKEMTCSRVEYPRHLENSHKPNRNATRPDNWTISLLRRDTNTEK